MSNEEIKELCLSLMKAETEDEVIEIIKQAGYWDRPECWRYYGDKENNYSAAGNQADEAEAALVEKITNSRDAILMNECLIRGIDPKSENAPSGVREAVATFFEEYPENELAGQIKEWDPKKRREVAKLMSVYVTGNKQADGYPCLNFADRGEGQTPLEIPKTILSLGESIKRSIQFVHGKWNMGGTAALVYCGKQNLQFVISRRNSKLLEQQNVSNKSDKNWGFTIVRREDPKGLNTSSTYKYLAPVGVESNPNEGDILNFESKTFPIFAKYNEPYCVPSEWGTLIKLYEYETKYKDQVQKGLLRPLDLLAPDLGLPFRLHECRYQATKGSFEHQVNGLRVRLHDDRFNVLEQNYPTYHNPEIEGEKFTFAVYAFKDDKAKNYRDAGKGVIFVLNGQSQGWLDDRIFTRNKVGLGFLKNSLLIMIDCSELTYRGQERLFVNDRVHIKKGTEFYGKIEAEIIDYLSNHKGLAALQEERKRNLRAEKLDDSKPLEAVLSNVFKHSSALSKIFLKGQKLSNAFRSDRVGIKEQEYEGKQYPTYFKFKKLDYGKVLLRDAYQETRNRIGFETDADNDYFNRKTNKGSYKLFMYKNGQEREVRKEDIIWGLNLYNGIATLTIDLDSQFSIGEKLKFVLEVTDPLRIADPPFRNQFELTVHPKAKKGGGGNHDRIKPPTDIPGKDRDKPGGVKFPKVYKVYEKDWGQHEGFNKYSALRVVKSKSTDNGSESVDFTFYVNLDNIYLQHEVKEDMEHKSELEAYFEYGMALLGISVIYDDQQNKSEEDKFEGIEERISEFSRAMGPMIIPMIKEFHDLDLKAELIKELAD